MVIVYKHTNNINGKSYIGYAGHRKDDVGNESVEWLLERRWQEHVQYSSNDDHTKALARAIRKYGEEVFIHEILEVLPTQKEAALAETRLIAEHKTFGRNGYNMTTGGDGVLGGLASIRTSMSLGQRRRFAGETPEQKQQRVARHIEGGKRIRGTLNPASKLTIEQVENIRQLLAQGVRIKDITPQFNVCHKVIQSIKHGYSYKS